MSKPLYFLTHEGDPQTFSGYGIPIKEGDKSLLVGMMLAEGTEPSTEQYIRDLKTAFGDVQVGPMTLQGDRGVYARIRIEDLFSLALVRDDIYPSVAGYIASVMELALNKGHYPNPKLRVCWSREEQRWVGEFDLEAR